jgi:two-component system, NarL family, sensor kinase
MDADQSNIFTAILISCILLGIIISYFIFSITRQQRRNLQLHRRNILAEINTLEKERTRIAADLHDELGPLLAVIKFKINSVESADAQDQKELAHASSHIDGLIKRIREISANLMPSALARKGLVIALQEFISNISRATVNITFKYSDLPELNQEQKINIYRIVQEIVHNTIKHAKATELVIDLSAKQNVVVLMANDNGIGFYPGGEGNESDGLGLRNLKSRTELMRGKFDIDSKPDNGTTYYFEIPIN